MIKDPLHLVTKERTVLGVSVGLCHLTNPSECDLCEGSTFEGHFVLSCLKYTTSVGCTRAGSRVVVFVARETRAGGLYG